MVFFRRIAMMRSGLVGLAMVCGALFHLGAHAAGEQERLLVIKNHLFEPAELKVPANTRIKLIVHNQDATPEEFESHSLNREKVIPAGAKVSLFVGPLKPGRYPFVGEFHEATTKGVLVVE
jgi:plastocyanin